MTTYTGPCQMDCPQECAVPEGFKLSVVPTPRHDWGDVMHCPNDGCGRSLLIVTTPAGGTE